MRTKLLKQRLHKKMSQDEVAKLAGIDRGYYSGIERGSRHPSLEISRKIADVLQFNLDPKGMFDIFNKEEDEEDV